MTGPEITRDEALLRVDDPHSWLFARTVVALYDRLDAAHAKVQELAEAGGRLIAASILWDGETPEAMRACIDRLRDGWQADSGTSWDKDGWRWVKLNDDRSGIVREPMTPAEQAVMAR